MGGVAGCCCPPEGRAPWCAAHGGEPLALFDSTVEVVPTVPEHRVRALAGVVAGFRWPGRGSFEKLTGPQKTEALAAARSALERLAAFDR